MVSVSVFSSEKNELQVEKTGENSEKFFIILFAQIQSEKKFDVIFRLKRNLHKPRKINEAMNTIFSLGHEI